MTDQQPTSDAEPLNPIVAQARARVEARARRRRLPFLIASAALTLALGAGAVVGAGLLQQASIEGAEVSQDALSLVKDDPEVQRLLGLPVRVQGPWMGPIFVTDPGAPLQARVGLAGDRGEAELRFDGAHDGDMITFSTIALVELHTAEQPELRALDLMPAAEERARLRREAMVAPDLAEAERLAKRGELQAAERMTDRVLLMEPQHLEAASLRARLRHQREDYAAAEDDLLFILGQDPTRSDDQHRLGRVRAARADYPGCVSAFTVLIRENAGDGPAWYGRAACQHELSKEPADEALRRTAAAGAREACRLGEANACALAREIAP